MIYELGKRLKELREAKHFSQGEVARRLGLTRATISGYECGNAQPPLDILAKLALLYGCSADYILGLEERRSVSLEGLTPRHREWAPLLLPFYKDFGREKKKKQKPARAGTVPWPGRFWFAEKEKRRGAPAVLYAFFT